MSSKLFSMNFMSVQSKLIENIKCSFSLECMERIDDILVHKAVLEILTNLVILRTI